MEEFPGTKEPQPCWAMHPRTSSQPESPRKVLFENVPYVSMSVCV